MPTYLHSALTHRIIGIFYDVYDALGYDFLGKVYENAMTLRLRDAGLQVVQKAPIRVYSDSTDTG